MLFIPLWVIFGDVAQSLVDFGHDPVVVNVAMSDITVQITMTTPGDPDPDRARFVTSAPCRARFRRLPSRRA